MYQNIHTIIYPYNQYFLNSTFSLKYTGGTGNIYCLTFLFNLSFELCGLFVKMIML